MAKEIFGPILPVLTYRSFEEVAPFVTRDKPLALYVFASDKARLEQVLAKQRSISRFLIDYAWFTSSFVLLDRASWRTSLRTARAESTANAASHIWKRLVLLLGRRKAPQLFGQVASVLFGIARHVKRLLFATAHP